MRPLTDYSRLFFWECYLFLFLGRVPFHASVSFRSHTFYVRNLTSLLKFDILCLPNDSEAWTEISRKKPEQLLQSWNHMTWRLAKLKAAQSLHISLFPCWMWVSKHWNPPTVKGESSNSFSKKKDLHTNLLSLKNGKLCQHRFWPCHENGPRQDDSNDNLSYSYVTLESHTAKGKAKTFPVVSLVFLTFWRVVHLYMKLRSKLRHRKSEVIFNDLKTQDLANFRVSIFI